MKVFYRPDPREWNEILQRPSANLPDLTEPVSAILADVAKNGDEALHRYSWEFDRCRVDSLQVAANEFTLAEGRVALELKAAIALASSNIAKFHSAQREDATVVETTSGVFCWRKSVAIERVGIYIPAGTAPLFSTVLMLAIPARLAGCGEVVLCSPPNQNGQIADAILYAAAACGVTKVFRVGGAQAIGALAYGTESIPQVDKIFGPGNRYVTRAKKIVAQTGTAIDLPAGPSEVAVIADESCVPAFVAADLLAQAEHGIDSQVILITTSEKVIDETRAEIEKRLVDLPRREIACASLGHSSAILAADLNNAVALANEYAPEHLILAVENAEDVAERITNAGSVFIGNYSCESAGDYASGTNHTLPTGGFARSYSGVSLDSFVKKITFQKLTPEGLRNLGPAIECLAAAEGMEAHRRAVSVRLEGTNGI